MAVTEELFEGTSIRRETGEEVSPHGVLSLLQQAVRRIDQMWHAAQAEGRHSAAVSLGEASYGIHRALIALQVEGVQMDRALA